MSNGPGAEATSASLSLTTQQSLAEAYLELGKARLTSLVVITALVGFLLASQGPIDWMGLFWTLVGTTLIVGGANAFNQTIESDLDARMMRTQGRPVVTGRVSWFHALTFSAVTSATGLAILTVLTNPLTGFLAFVAFAVYVAVYTPLKTRSPMCTLVGAISGAIPPMMGWTAASGHLALGAWLLFALLFVWQIPHFLALAWMCREDYERGGFVMLPLIDRSGRVTCRLVLLYSLLMLPLGLAFPLAGLAGWVYTMGSVLLGGGMVALSIVLFRRRTTVNARRLFLASVIYLPLLLGLMIADRSTFSHPAERGAPAVAMAEAPARAWAGTSSAPTGTRQTIQISGIKSL